MRKFKNILIPLIMFLLILGGLYVENYQTSDNLASDGILTLDEGDLDNLINLDGDWMFLSQDVENSTLGYTKLPIRFKKDLLENGIGIYKLHIESPTNITKYGLKFQMVRTVFDVYIDGELRLQVDENNIMEKGYETILFDNDTGQIELEIHVHKFIRGMAGMTRQIKFGERTVILKHSLFSYIYESSLVLSLIILSVFLRGIYQDYKKRKETLLLSRMLMILAIYIAITDEKVMKFVFTVPYDYLLISQFLSVYALGYHILLFIEEVFIDKVNKNVIRQIKTGIIVMSLSSWLILVLDSRLLYDGLYYVAISIILIIALYALIILVKNTKGNDKSNTYIQITAWAFFSYLVLKILGIIFYLKLGYGLDIAITVMVTTLILFIMGEINSDQKKLIQFAEELKQSDQLLDQMMNNIISVVDPTLTEVEQKLNRILVGEYGTFSKDLQKDLMKAYQLTESTTKVLDDLKIIGTSSNLIEHLNIVRIDLRDLLDDVINHKNWSSIVKNNLPHDLPKINGSYSDFYTIFHNIVDKAILNKMSGFTVVLEGASDKKSVILIISYRGSKVEGEDLNRLFDPFYSINPQNYQSGLEMAVTKSLLTKYGGKIEVNSGDITTKFIMEIPINNQYYVAERKEEHRIISDPRVSVLSNNRTIIKSVKLITTNYQYYTNHTNLATTDLVILDGYDPNVSAEIKNIRNRYEMFELPILIAVFPQDRENFYDTGINDFLSLPINMSQLKGKVETILKARETVVQGIQKELNFFHSQISPHFLYNTMNTIIGLSYVDVDKSREAMNYLSIYLRQKLKIFRDDAMIEINEELELVFGFVEIQKMRYGDKIEVIYEVESDINGYIPPLIVQTIVENTFMHAFDFSNKQNLLTIRIKKENKNVLIEIIDNGRGMSEEEIENIYQTKSTGMGLKSTMEVLALIPGSKFKIKSIKGEGTSVKMKIPDVKQVIT